MQCINVNYKNYGKVKKIKNKKKPEKLWLQKEA